MNELTLADVVHDGPSDGRRSQRAAAKRKKKRRRRTWVSALVGLAVIAGALSIAWLTLKPVLASLNEPKDYPGPGSGDVTITVAQGATVTQIGQTLQKNDVVKTVGAFVDAVTAQPGSGNKIQPGVYPLKRQMAATGALAVLTDPANRLVDRVTIPEGKRLTEILDLIADKTSIPKADLEAAAKNPTAIGLPPQAKGQAEGWLFPATYEVTPDTTAESLLTEMVQRTQQELADLGVPEDKWLSTLTLASLVQAETGRDEDSPKIARVLVNRLEQGITLRLDTTINYILKRYRVAVSYAETRTPSPYNTYLHVGLPPGPIDSPGAVAMKAALNPLPGPWMHFVATDPDSGITEFATTEAERLKLVAKLREWQKANPGR